MKKVFITGATGFIGGRLAEVLNSKDIEVVALVRKWERAASLARLNVKMVAGDILNIESLLENMAGCDVVFHCAVDNRIDGEEHKHTSAAGTENVLKVAKENKVKRVVHLSSAAVFGYKPELEVITEESPIHYNGDSYCDGKIESEKVAMQFYKEHGLPIAILRPTIVYGPFGSYSAETARLLKEQRIVYINGGKGICNALYVDNLIEAMLLAAESDKAIGEIFNISDAETISWQDFIKGHAKEAGTNGYTIPEKTRQEIELELNKPQAPKVSSFKQFFKVIRDPKLHDIIYTIPIVKLIVDFIKNTAESMLSEETRIKIRKTLFGQVRVYKKVKDVAPLPKTPEHLARWELDMFTAFEKTKFSIEKAQRVLGYQSKIDFKEGSRRTSLWIKWARL